MQNSFAFVGPRSREDSTIGYRTSQAEEAAKALPNGGQEPHSAAKEYSTTKIVGRKEEGEGEVGLYTLGKRKEGRPNNRKNKRNNSAFGWPLMAKKARDVRRKRGWGEVPHASLAIFSGPLNWYGGPEFLALSKETGGVGTAWRSDKLFGDGGGKEEGGTVDN